MAHVINDRVKETTTTTGTGAVSLGGAVTGFETFAAGIGNSNTTSWLGNNSPALLLYGCLAEAFKFLKGPAEMLQLYEQSYQRALQELVIEQQGRHRRDEYMHGALRTPLQSQNP